MKHTATSMQLHTDDIVTPPR